jgi:20S proteasome alpha/beta subunit
MLQIASYGSLARFRDVERLIPVGETTVVGASGDISDLQYIKHMLDSLVLVSTYKVLSWEGYLFTKHVN